jgi:hypothetical protein
LFFSPPQEAITTNETIFVNQNFFISREREKDVCQTNSGKKFSKFKKKKFTFLKVYGIG